MGLEQNHVGPLSEQFIPAFASRLSKMGDIDTSGKHDKVITEICLLLITYLISVGSSFQTVGQNFTKMYQRMKLK